MKCPKCGLVNAATATRCDCGFGFQGHSVVPPVNVAPPGERLRRVGCTLALLAMLASIALRLISEKQDSVRLAAGVLGDVLAVAAFAGLAVWIIGTLRKRRARL